MRKFIMIILLASCNPYKSQLNYKGDINMAIENTIVDYYYSNKKYIKKYEVFEIVVNDVPLNSDYYSLSILPHKNFYYLSPEDTIGAYPKYFPTKYKQYKNKLFVWNDKNEALNKNILNELHSYSKLDSIRLRYQLGIYPNNDTIGVYPEIPSFKLDETLRAMNYIICKNEIKKIIKSKSQLLDDELKSICK